MFTSDQVCWGGGDWCSWALGCFVRVLLYLGVLFFLLVGINRVSKGRWGWVGIGCHSVCGWAGTGWDRVGSEAEEGRRVPTETLFLLIPYTDM